MRNVLHTDSLGGTHDLLSIEKETRDEQATASLEMLEHWHAIQWGRLIRERENGGEKKASPCRRLFVIDGTYRIE